MCVLYMIAITNSSQTVVTTLVNAAANVRQSASHTTAGSWSRQTDSSLSDIAVMMSFYVWGVPGVFLVAFACDATY